MNKLAVFVEGNTELVFVTQLLLELAGHSGVTITRQRLHGDAIRELRGRGAPPDEAAIMVLVVDCSTDGRVRSAILDRKVELARAGYNRVIGLRDVFPTPRANIAELSHRLQQGLDAIGVPARIVLAVMEIEAWFLAEHTHFVKLHPDLTPQKIFEVTGFDTVNDDPQSVDHPAALIEKIYAAVGLRYRKSNDDAHRIVANLDFDSLCVAVRERVPSLHSFLEELENFIAA
jgi:hypothetical protein